MRFFRRRVLVVKPGASPAFPPAEQLPRGEGEVGLVALGGVLSVPILIEAYSKGVFPWEGRDPLPWCSPDPRAILVPERLHTSRKLLKLDRQGRYLITFDRAFEQVMRSCALIKRRGQKGTWITPRMVQVYGELHRQGYAGSVEVWRPVEADQMRLVGGLYGVKLGPVFFGESMFAAEPDTSKLALLHLCRRMVETGGAFIDCQQDTAHMRRMGSEVMPRAAFIERLRAAGVPEGGL